MGKAKRLLPWIKFNVIVTLHFIYLIFLKSLAQSHTMNKSITEKGKIQFWILTF